ncbi:hypothetical protein [Streptomyces flavofungini]|uniref:hypothetical protein n=1 Tax=Streptomyces flavofungini TaxID=68200 RepID=UPI0034DE5765
MTKSIEQIAADFNRGIRDSKGKADEKEAPHNINTGTLYGGQHISTVTVEGDWVKGDKGGKRRQ